MMQPDATRDDAISPEISNRETTAIATEQQPEATAEQPKSAQRKRPDRGVRTFEDFEKASPYAVQWRVDGKRKTEFFKTADDRDRRATALRKERRSNTLAFVPSRDEMQEWAAFKAAIGEVDWRDVVTGWKRGGGVAVTLTMKEAVDRYLAQQDERLADGRLAKVTHKKNCPKAKMFAADFGNISVAQVTSDDIEEWIDDLGFEAAETFNTYRKVLHAVFESCRKERPLNPVADIPLRDDRGDIGIISVDDTQRLLMYAMEHYSEIVPRLALECFAGLRFSSAFRLERSDINFEDRGILLPKHKLKTKRRHYVDGLPENLFDWIELETPATWAITPREYRRLKSKCFADAKVRHPHNCLRHGFCSYHVAAFKNPGLTATILCHRNQDQLWDHYKGRATQKDGLRYFELRPPGKTARKPGSRRKTKSPEAAPVR